MLALWVSPPPSLQQQFVERLSLVALSLRIVYVSSIVQSWLLFERPLALVSSAHNKRSSGE